MDVPIGDSQKLCLKINQCEIITIKDGDHRLVKQQSKWIPKVVKFFERNMK